MPEKNANVNKEDLEYEKHKLERLEKHDNLTMQHLYENQRKIQETQIQLLVTIENGLKSTVECNLENIEEIKKEHSELTKKLLEKEYYKSGYTSFLNFLKDNMGWGLAILLVILQILEYIDT